MSDYDPLRLTASELGPGLIVTPLDLDANGNVVLIRGSYPPYMIIEVDYDREVVKARVDILGDVEEHSFAEWGILRTADEPVGVHCVMETKAALPVLNTLRGPMPIPGRLNRGHLTSRAVVFDRQMA